MSTNLDRAAAAQADVVAHTQARSLAVWRRDRSMAEAVIDDDVSVTHVAERLDISTSLVNLAVRVERARRDTR